MPSKESKRRVREDDVLANMRRCSSNRLVRGRGERADNAVLEKGRGQAVHTFESRSHNEDKKSKPVKSLFEHVCVNLDGFTRIDCRSMYQQPALDLDLRPGKRQRDVGPSFSARLHGCIPT